MKNLDEHEDFEVGNISSDDYFIYELIEHNGILGWKMYAKDDKRVFKCNSVYKGYPVLYMGYTFSTCHFETIDVSGMDVSNVISMKSAFDSNVMIETLDISTWDISRVTDFRLTFCGCTSLKEVKLPSIELPDHVDFYSMFYSCSELKRVDMSGIQPRSIQRLFRMFSGCYKLEYIDLRSIRFSNIDAKISELNTIFEGDNNLKCLVLHDKKDAELIANWMNNSPSLKISPMVLKLDTVDENKINKIIDKMQLIDSGNTCICMYIG